MNSKLKFYGYSWKNISLFDTFVVPFFILFPLSYELEFISPKYVAESLRKKDFRKIAANFIYYILRVGLFFKYYWKTARGYKFQQPVLSDLEPKKEGNNITEDTRAYAFKAQ